MSLSEDARPTATGEPVPPDLPFAGLAAVAGMLGAGTVTSAAVVGQSLDRIAELQPVLEAFRVVRDAAARAEAAEADRRLAAGERLPLLGVPVAIKDDTDLAGETTPFGCAGDCEPRTTDAEVVRRLRAAGAVIVGKTKTSEFGQWPMGDTDAFGVTRNPWDPAKTPGGSSAGSAAAVAAGLVPGAIGSDGAGSVRIPAAWTGLVGLKPQRGRISGWPDADPFFGITTNGPLTRSVDDAALLLDVVSGNHPGDRFWRARPAVPFREAARRSPGRLRIALSFRVPFFVEDALDPEIRASVERLAGVLEGLGHEVFPADPDYGLVGMSFLPRGSAGSADWVKRIPNARVERATEFELKLGKVMGGRVLRTARALEPHYRRKVGRIFERADVVLTPTTAQHPLPVGAFSGLGWWAAGQLATAACPYCWVWNTLGWPGLSVPSGFSRSGLPIGAQLLGREADEATLLALGAQLEEAERWTERRPPVAARG
ncbi:MAG TPA: amidase [Acidimicrobiales bacterium]